MIPATSGAAGQPADGFFMIRSPPLTLSASNTGWNQPEPMYDQYYRAPKVVEDMAIQLNDYLMLGAALGIPALFCFGMYIRLLLTRTDSLQQPPQSTGFSIQFIVHNPKILDWKPDGKRLRTLD